MEIGEGDIEVEVEGPVEPCGKRLSWNNLRTLISRVFPREKFTYPTSSTIRLKEADASATTPPDTSEVSNPKPRTRNRNNIKADVVGYSLGVVLHLLIVSYK